jgi:hypothetical protein
VQPQVLHAGDLESLRLSSPCAGLFLFAPLLGQLDLDGLVRAARLPDVWTIPARSYLLSLLAWKLLGAEHLPHLKGQPADRATGLFAGLNALPDRSALSRYASSLDGGQLTRLQQEFFIQVTRLGLYDGTVARVDRHVVPDGQPARGAREGARSRHSGGVTCLEVRDVESTRMLYTATAPADSDHVDHLRSFCNFWQRVRGGAAPTLLFGARFLTYAQLSELDARGIRFLTLRRRGRNLLERAAAEARWQRLHIPAAQDELITPLAHESTVTLRGYRGSLRQAIVRGSDGELPLFLLSNDFDTPIEQLVGRLARSLQRERRVASSIEFFHWPASPTHATARCDAVLTMLADTLYSMLAKQLRGFEEEDAAKLCRYFVQGGGIVDVRQGAVTVTCPRGDRVPALRDVPWRLLPQTLPGLDGVRLQLRFD